MGTRPETEAVLTTTPWPRAFMAAAATAPTSTTAVAMRSMASLSGAVSVVARG